MQPPDTARRGKETRRLKLLIAALAVATALLGVLLYPTLGFATLLAPFVFFVLCCALVLSLDGYDLHRHRTATRLQADRRREAQRHAMPPPGNTRTTGFHAAAHEAAAESFARTQRAMTDAEAHGIPFGSVALPDEEFLRRFNAGELCAQEFRHGDHLRFTWMILERLPLGMAEESIAQALRGFLRRINGSSAQFHATRTHGWLAVLASLPQRTFAEALAANTAALHCGALTRYWSQALLDSPAARAAAPPPDLQPLPAPATPRTRRYRPGNTSLPPAPHAPVMRSSS